MLAAALGSPHRSSDRLAAVRQDVRRCSALRWALATGDRQRRDSIGDSIGRWLPPSAARLLNQRSMFVDPRLFPSQVSHICSHVSTVEYTHYNSFVYCIRSLIYFLFFFLSNLC
jgi:hypothetical protein